MGKIQSFINALQEYGDGRYHYYDGKPMGIGCSEYTRLALVKAGVIKSGESFHAGSGYEGVLADTSRFKRITFHPSVLKEGHILWSDGYHVATWAGYGADVRGSVYEAAPEDTHPLATCGTGVGLHKGHGYYNCGTRTNDWTCIYEIIENAEEKKPLKSKDYVTGALALQDRLLAYRNTFPWNCGLLDEAGVTWGDCWNINPKTMIWSMAVGDPIWSNQVIGQDHVAYVVTAGIKASGLQDVTGDYIMDHCCKQTTFRQMLQDKKAPCLLLINGAHMGAYIGDFVRDGKTYNVTEFSPNDYLQGKMRSYVDECGQRLTHKGGTVIGSWNRCGYLTAFLDYSDWDVPETEQKPQPSVVIETPAEDKVVVTADKLAREIYAGKWGVNPGRKASITATYGADMYYAAQNRVEQIVTGMSWYRNEVKIAEEILNGKWGNNPDRQSGITAHYGANAFRIAQGYVNDICMKKYTLADLKTAYDVAGGIICGIYGDGNGRKIRIANEFGETIRLLAQGMVNDIFK